MIQTDRYFKDYPIVDLIDPECINPASLDLRLGNKIKIPCDYWNDPEQREKAFVNNWPRWTDEIELRTWILQPGQFVLCHSIEVITIPDNMAGFLISKSSTGRIGLEHLHAGYFDPGFVGQAVWEFTNVAPWPIKLEYGQRIMQMVLVSTSQVPDRTYAETGRYQGQRGVQEAID